VVADIPAQPHCRQNTGMIGTRSKLILLTAAWLFVAAGPAFAKDAIHVAGADCRRLVA
jgi:hypothetical protein